MGQSHTNLYYAFPVSLVQCRNPAPINSGCHAPLSLCSIINCVFVSRFSMLGRPTAPGFHTIFFILLQRHDPMRMTTAACIPPPLGQGISLILAVSGAHLFLDCPLCAMTNSNVFHTIYMNARRDWQRFKRTNPHASNAASRIAAFRLCSDNCPIQGVLPLFQIRYTPLCSPNQITGHVLFVMYRGYPLPAGFEESLLCNPQKTIGIYRLLF